jgi:UDP:flavonoid glycosyltransferase YjiC (YdhE family)
MRILFSGVPALGHLLPLVPLARAAQAAGHSVGVLTSGGMTGILAAELPRAELLPAGPMPLELFAEVARRMPGSDPANRPEPASVAEFFAGTRVDLSREEALAQATAWRPDVIVADAVDFVGPWVAAALHLPHALVAFGPEVPEEFTQPMREMVGTRYTAAQLRPAPPIVVFDPAPPSLQAPRWRSSPLMIPFRPEPHRRDESSGSLPPFPPSEGRPRILVTLGTVFGDTALLEQILDSIRPLDADVTATVTGPGATRPRDSEHVHFVGFHPMGELLTATDAVVGAGGAGTVLAALDRGLPMVLIPQGADQFLNAERARAAGAAIVIEQPDETGPALRRLVDDATYAAAAQRLREEIRQRPTSSEAISELVHRVEREMRVSDR